MVAGEKQRSGIIIKVSGLVFWLTGAVLTAYAAEINTVSVFGALEPKQCYTWGIDSAETLRLAPGQIITEVILTVHNIRLNPDPNTAVLIPRSEQRWNPVADASGSGVLRFYLLDNPRYGFWPFRHEATVEDPFAEFGSLLVAEYAQGNLVYRLSRTHNPNSWTTKVFGNSMSMTLANGASVTLTSSLLEFIDYAGTGYGVGFGIRPADTVYYYDDITLAVTVQSYTGVYTTGMFACRIGDGPSPESPYTLTIASDHGSVVVSPQRRAYSDGETVMLTATPLAGYTFSGWSGAAIGTANPLTIRMNGDKSIRANFIESSRSSERGG